MRRSTRNWIFSTVLSGLLPLCATAPAAMAATPTAPPLVTPAWLKAHLHDPNLVVVEVYDFDKQAPQFEAAHIPGAVFTGFLSDKWRVTVNNVPQMLPPGPQIAAVIGGLGIANNSRVVLVPAGAKEGDFEATTRIFWTLAVEGQTNVSILNGGDVAWQANATNPVATGASTPKPAVFEPHFNSALNATLPLVQADIDSSSPHYQLVDARPVKQFTGQVKPPVNARAGTIPGAVNLPFSSLFTADNEGIKSPAEIKAALSAAKVTTTRPTVAFCNTGHLASSDWFVMHEVLKMPDVKLYDGSMTEWTHHDELPVVLGKASG